MLSRPLKLGLMTWQGGLVLKPAELNKFIA